MDLLRMKYIMMTLLIMLYIPAVALTRDPSITVNLPFIMLSAGTSALLIPYIIDSFINRKLLVFSAQIMAALILLIMGITHILYN